MATTESGLSPSDIGRQLRAVRKAKGLSRAEVARSAGLTRRELAAYERGRTPIPESDLWCLAGSCGVDVSELLPHGHRLPAGSDLASLTVGDSVRRLRAHGAGDGLQREYLAMIQQLRSLPPGAHPPLRDEDLSALADALGGTPAAIEARLQELTGATREEAMRLRARILRPRSLGAAPTPADPAPFTGDDLLSGSTELPALDDPYEWAREPVSVMAGSPTPATPAEPPPLSPPPGFDVAPVWSSVGDPDAAARFFDAPRVDDPFAPPPPLESLAPLPPLHVAVRGPEDPARFPPPSGPPLDGLAPPSGPPGDLETAGEGAPAAPDLPGPDDPWGVLPSSVGPDPWERRDPDRLAWPSWDVPPGPDPDPFGPAEIVALEPAAAIDDVVPGPVPAGVPEDRDEDPFAVLRAPVDEPTEVLPVAGLPPEPTFVASEGLTGDPDTDSPEEWFNRAAAAADALVAEQRQDPPEALTSEPAARDGTALAPISWSLVPPSTPPSRSPSTPPVPDRFVAAGPHWDVGGIFPATATADDGTLALRRADVRWALADVAAGGDFTVRATVDFTSGAGFGILFRVSVDDQERISGYSFDVDPIYSGGGFLVRQWNDNRQHWKPLAHAPVADPSRLYGQHTIEVSLRADQLQATVDGEPVLSISHLSRCSIDSGREPCRGSRVGVQAWSTTEVTIDHLLVADHTTAATTP